ncbi:zinc-ribbon domain-containing protein, partial [Mycobacterium avium]
NCGSALGFSIEQMALLVISEDETSGHAGFVPASEYQLCANLLLAECNWLVPVNEPRLLCASCVLTTERPNDADSVG